MILYCAFTDRKFLRYIFIKIVESRFFLDQVMQGLFHHAMEINYTIIPWATVFSNTATALFAYAVYRTLHWDGDYRLHAAQKAKAAQ